MPVTTITSLQQFQDIIKGDKPVLVDFWAPWCGPCKAISPIFERISNNTEEVEFYKVNIDDVGPIAEELRISSIPTFMLFKEGSKVGAVVGADSKALEALVAKATM